MTSIFDQYEKASQRSKQAKNLPTQHDIVRLEFLMNFH